MKHIKICVAIILLFCSILFFSGCETIDVTKMRIGGSAQTAFFEDTKDKEKNDYLIKHEKELEYAKVDNTFILIQHKEISHTEGRIWIYACTNSQLDNSYVKVKSFFLTDNNGNVIYQNNACNIELTPTTPNNVYDVENNILLTYTMTEDWYYEGNKLTLSIELEFNGIEKQITYDIEIYTTQSTVWIT